MSALRIRVLLGLQRLELRDGDRLLADFPVSTAARGAGERLDSLQTPRGRHEIAARIGAGAAPGSVVRATQGVKPRARR